MTSTNAREERLAAALRQNLRRRKAQSAARDADDAAPADGADTDAPADGRENAARRKP